MKFFLCFAVFVPIIAALKWVVGWAFIPWWFMLVPLILWVIVLAVVTFAFIALFEKDGSLGL